MITANDVKTKGVACFEQALINQPETMITVRGKERYVVMTVQRYHHLREIELEAALMETKQDVSQGKVHKSTVDEHVAELFER